MQINFQLHLKDNYHCQQIETMAWDWKVLCGRNDSDFTTWDYGDFGLCFEHLIIICIPHILLAIVSTYHFSRHQQRRLRGNIPHSVTLHIRLICAIFLALSPLVLLGLTYLYEKIHPSMVDVISWSIRAISWFIHSGFLKRLERLYHIHIRGPTIVVLSFILTTASMIIQLRTVIIHHGRGTNYFKITEQVITYIMSALHFIYAMTLIPWRRPPVTQDPRQTQAGINAEETQGLLDSRSQQSNYNTIPTLPRIDLGVAQLNSNCLSKLFFWWVQPLMVKGSKGGIEKAEDLFRLPKELNTKLLDERFQAVLSNRYISQASHSITVSSNASINQESEPISSVHNDANVRDVSNTKRPSLISAFNKTFGCEFYSLGILKFVGDTLGFAGPILLNYLVSYMEDPTQPIWHGYVYAACLFASTFLSSMFSTHFDYLINITGMKIRAAIITSVYRKSISVSSVSLTRFSSGEVVNFMSTDSDRIVNFCPSFHQFWSLPIQVGISLFLLYSQVGLAFLAGLGFAIILIPINKWIADRIGALSKDMMEQKDGRVKVCTMHYM